MSLAQGQMKLSKNRYEIINANQSCSKMAFFPPLYVPACLFGMSKIAVFCCQSFMHNNLQTSTFADVQ